MENSNPLAKHYRQPQLWIKLPSQGKFYKEGTIDYPQSGEIAIYSMSAKDEILFKNPDALLNGEATKLVIESCVPAIKDAWAMPAIDLDTILIAIRRATYGNEMEFTTQCPSCETAVDAAVDLSVVADSIAVSDYNQGFEIDNLKIFFKPVSYFTFNQANLENFKRQQTLAVLLDESLSEEERKQQFTAMFLTTINENLKTLSEAINYIITEDGERVRDQTFISEFIGNCDRKIYDKIIKKLEETNEENKLKPLNITCSNPECGKIFPSTLTFEQSNFFG